MNELNLIHLSFQEVVIDNNGLELDSSEILRILQTCSTFLDSFNSELNKFSFSILGRFSNSHLNWMDQSLRRFAQTNQCQPVLEIEPFLRYLFFPINIDNNIKQLTEKG
jgi:hypothetical protein